MVTVVKLNNSFFFSTRKNQWKQLRASGIPSGAFSDADLDDLGTPTVVFQGDVILDNADDLKALYQEATKAKSQERQQEDRYTPSFFNSNTVPFAVATIQKEGIKSVLVSFQLDINAWKLADADSQPITARTFAQIDASGVVHPGPAFDKAFAPRKESEDTAKETSPLAPYFTEGKRLLSETLNNHKAHAYTIGSGQIVMQDRGGFGVWSPSPIVRSDPNVGSAIKNMGAPTEAKGIREDAEGLVIADAKGTPFLFEPTFLAAAFLSLRPLGDVKITLREFGTEPTTRVAWMTAGNGTALAVGKRFLAKQAEIEARAKAKDLSGDYDLPPFKFKVYKVGRSYSIRPLEDIYAPALIKEVGGIWDRKNGTFDVKTDELRVIIAEAKSGRIPESLRAREERRAQFYQTWEDLVQKAKAAQQRGSILFATQYGELYVNDHVRPDYISGRFDDWQTVPYYILNRFGARAGTGSFEMKTEAEVDYFMETLAKVITGKPPVVPTIRATQSQTKALMDLTDALLGKRKDKLAVVYRTVETLPGGVLTADGEYFVRPGDFAKGVMRRYDNAVLEAKKRGEQNRSYRPDPPVYAITEVYRSVLKAIGDIVPSLSFSLVEEEDSSLRPGDVVDVAYAEGDDYEGVGIIEEDLHSGMPRRYRIDLNGEKIILPEQRLRRTDKSRLGEKASKSSGASIQLPENRIRKILQILSIFTPKEGANRYGMGAALLGKAKGTFAESTDGNTAISIQLNEVPGNSRLAATPTASKETLKAFIGELAAKSTSPVTWETSAKKKLWSINGIEKKANIADFPDMHGLWIGRDSFRISIDLTKVAEKTFLKEGNIIVENGSARAVTFSDTLGMPNRSIPLPFIRAESGKAREFAPAVFKAILDVGVILGADTIILTQKGESRKAAFFASYSGGITLGLEMMAIFMPVEPYNWVAGEDRGEYR